MRPLPSPGLSSAVDAHLTSYPLGRPWRTIGLDGFACWIIEDGTVINRKPSDAARWDADGQGALS